MFLVKSPFSHDVFLILIFFIFWTILTILTVDKSVFRFSICLFGVAPKFKMLSCSFRTEPVRLRAAQQL